MVVSEPRELPDLMTVAEVAEVLKSSTKHVYRLIERENSPFKVSRLGPRTLRVYRSSVTDYIRGGTVEQ